MNDPSVAEKIQAAWLEVGVLESGVDLAAYQAAGVGLAASAAPSDSSAGPAQPGSSEQPATVAVCRSGGFAGTTKVGELDLDSDPEGPEVRHLLMRVGMQPITSTRPTPDRFIYTVEYGDWHLTVPEQDLTPELRRLVQVVLNRGG
jgi:hypothetical protein